MPLTLRRGRVTAIGERLDELVRLEVDGAPCIAYPRLTGSVEVGDDVLVNTQARDLGLGSGGFHVLYANLTRGLDLPAAEGAHVIALPYTQAQVTLCYLEETAELPASLDGLPVVLCTLHSQVAPACAALRGRRVAYVQVAGGALPVSLSDTVRALKARGLVGVACAVAPCLDGDVNAVTAAAAFAWSRAEHYEAVVCSLGPGIVGTGSSLGHGALAVADAGNVARALGGRPILAVRLSSGDARERHRGVSHHTEAVLRIADVEVAWPTGAPFDSPPGAVELEVSGWREDCAGLPLAHMGRGPDEDPWFFAGAYAAGVLARR